MIAKTHLNQERKKKHSVLRPAILPALITAVIVALLYGVLFLINADFLYNSSSIILFAAFGSSAFLLFMAPHSTTAKPSKFVKSYVIATILGPIGYVLVSYIPIFLATGIMIFIMSILLYTTHSEHPPAIGIMLAFILYKIDVYGILIVIFGIIMLMVIRSLLEKYIYDIDNEMESVARLEH